LTAPRRGSLDTAQGEVQYLAVPVRMPGDTRVRGVLLAGELPAERDERVGTALRKAGIGLLGGAAVAAVAGGLLLVALNRARGEPVTSGTDRPAPARFDARRLLGDAAYELRTPLVMARGQLDLDADGALPPAASELDRIGEVVDAMLLLAGADSDDFLQLRPVDVRALLDGVRGRADALGSRAWTVTADGIPELCGDRARLEQALDVLARSAVRQGGPRGELALTATRAGDDVRLEVRAVNGVPSGLARSVADAVARAHGGCLDLRDGPVAATALVVPTGGPARRAEQAEARPVAH
jgi:signal transduction histidine kinase